MQQAKVCPGKPYPLGSSYDGEGVNFSIFSEVAERVELCLFDVNGNQTSVDLPEVTAFCWHGYLPGVLPGQRYGFRVQGPWSPENGSRCNPAKLLLDPYTKAIEGQVQWNEAVYPYRIGEPDTIDDKDSAPFVPKSVVIETGFDWNGDRHPEIPWHKTVIYEIHVKGFTATHPDIPPGLRGTYAGLAHRSSIEYLKSLGITALELMPVHQFIHYEHLAKKSLRNYWGYSTIGYFSPHNEYSSSGQSGQQVQEFKQMVRELHKAGIEVILDVVYNHTSEGNHLGPMLSLKGIDNGAYYRLMPDDQRYYMDYTGTGNSLNMMHPHVLQLIMDSLRYWVLEMHVDGFRFDLAATLARELHDVDRLSAFFDIIQQDPVISQVKLIAEPWDLGEGGYQIGKFPVLWSEWNGKYRDTVRDYWMGRYQTLSKFAYSFTGSSDLYGHTGRRPYASINFVTAHDGFTLNDLVSFNEKHNEANVEENRDGTDDNRSWNCGVEGPTEDPDVNKLRDRQKRNFLTTLFLSQGVSMLLGGDEIGRTQQGNNNAYCQDNKISWYDWGNADASLLDFTRRLIHFYRKHPVFSRRKWLQDIPIHGTGVSDIGWFTPDGVEMSGQHRDENISKSFAIFLNGESLTCLDDRGERVVDDSFYLIFNAHYEPLNFKLPAKEYGKQWIEVVDTNGAFVGESERTNEAANEIKVEARSMKVFRRVS